VTTVVAPADREATEVDLLIAAQRAPASLATVDIPMKQNGWYHYHNYANPDLYNPGFANEFQLPPPTLAVDSAGNVYSGNDAVIYKTTSTGLVSLLAGTVRSYGAVDGVGSAARFGYTLSLTTDLSGQVYVADQIYDVIRKVGPAGDVVTVAGMVTAPGSGLGVPKDGDRATAGFTSLAAIAATASGRLLVADDSTIRSVAPDGSVVTIAGLSWHNATSSADGLGNTARFGDHLSCTLAPDGCLYVADSYNHTIRKVTPTGAVSTLAGRPHTTGSADGTGDAARFCYPRGIAADRSGNLYVTDGDNHTIRKVTPAGVVTTLAGQPGVRGNTNGTAAAATFDMPADIAVDGAGNGFVLCNGLPGARVLRLITPEGNVSTIHDGVEGPLVGDSAGNVYGVLGTTIVKLHPDGSTTAVLDVSATWPKLRSSCAEELASVGPFAVVPNGDIYHTRPSGFIRRITADGKITTLAGKWQMADDSSWPTISPIDGLGEAVRFEERDSSAVDSAGTVYLCDGSTIRKGAPAGPVTISTQPQSQSATAGTTVQFTVAATGVPAPTYQWQFNGAPISGATGATLSLPSVTAANAGSYTVVATNDLGSATSSAATLTVNPAPAKPSTPSSGGSSGGGGALGLGFAAAAVLLLAARRRGKFISAQ
jgi:sugar lactone lactonase YvrE